MNTESKPSTYWQIACGNTHRKYPQDFLRYRMAFVGGEKHCKTMGKVKAGDRIVMKSGKAVLAVGTAVERNGICSWDAGKDKAPQNKQWLGDFDGWNLPAYCYVDWRIHPRVKWKGAKNETIEPKEYIEVMGLGVTTMSRINKQSIKDEIDKIYNESNRILTTTMSPIQQIQ